MSRLRATVQLHDPSAQIRYWSFDAPTVASDDVSARAQIRDFLACVGQAVVDHNPRGVYHVIRPADCALVAADVQIDPPCVRADTGLPAGKLSVAISVAEAATQQLPVVPNHLGGTASAIEMQWAAARLLIECAAKNLREAHALLAPYEHHDPDDLVPEAETGR